jgi:hypothetical protein
VYFINKMVDSNYLRRITEMDARLEEGSNYQGSFAASTPKAFMLRSGERSPTVSSPKPSMMNK